MQTATVFHSNVKCDKVKRRIWVTKKETKDLAIKKETK
jgi:hypothetical protein